MSALLAIGWEPEIRGLLTVIIGTVALCGSVYLVLGTNIGARLGFLVSIAGLAGWMMLMGIIWMVYGIGLVGNSPSWKPAEPFSIVREGQYLLDAEVVVSSIEVDEDASFTEIADASGAAMEAEGWKLLPADDRGRGQASASADEIIQNEAEMYEAGEYEATRVFVRGGERYPKIGDGFDFFAFFHKPSYAVVEIAPLIPQRTEPGRAPARSVIDESQPRQYVVMIRDLGTKRQPAAFITFGSTIIFLLCCWMLHRRDRFVAVNRGLAIPVKV